MDIHERLREARAKRFKSAADAARYLDIPYGTYSGHENGGRGIKPEDVERYAKTFRVRRGWLMFGEGQMNGNAVVQVVGHIGAGAEVYPIDDHERGAGLDEVEVPGANSAIALIVKGDSMWPKYEDGEIIIVENIDRSPESLLNLYCYVKLADGRAFLKILAKGSKPGFFTLRSHNAPDIEDVVLERAYPVAWSRPRQDRGVRRR